MPIRQNMRHVTPIESIDDARIAPYRNLKDRDLARTGDRFLAESEHVVLRLLSSGIEVESVLLATRRVEEIAPLVGPDVMIYAADAKVVNAIVGYKFHSGVMAVGVRPGRVSLDESARKWVEPVTLVICPEVSNNENLGGLMRVCAAFGVTALLLGPKCCDPFYRQSIRVSMGTVFHLPLIFSEDLGRDLSALREKWKVEVAAAVLDESAEALAGAGRTARLGVMFGNEAQGLSAEQIGMCDRRITIPMKLGTDSLNVAVSAGIVLYHFTTP